jgi:hypothetical protein
MHGNVTHASCHSINAMANDGAVEELQDAHGQFRHGKLDSASDFCHAVSLRDSKVQVEVGSCSE